MAAAETKATSSSSTITYPTVGSAMDIIFARMNEENGKEKNIYFIFDTKTVIQKNEGQPDTARLLQISWNLINAAHEDLETETYFTDSDVSLGSILDKLNTALARTTHIVAHNALHNYNILCDELHRIDSETSRQCLEKLQNRKRICTMIETRHWCYLKRGRHGHTRYPKLNDLYRKCFGTVLGDTNSSEVDVKTLTKAFKYMRTRRVFEHL